MLEAERAPGRHLLHEEVSRVLERGQARGVRAPRRVVARGGRVLVQPLVRPDLIVLRPERVEGALLQCAGPSHGRIAWRLSVRCIRSCAPFCCGATGMDALMLPPQPHE